MSQPGLFVSIYLVGVAVAIALGPLRRTALCCALGFPVGLAVTALGLLFLLLLSAPLAALPAVLVAVLALCARQSWRRGGLNRHVVVTVVGWSVAFAVAAFALTRGNVALMSYDSHHFVMLGGVIAADGGFSAYSFHELHEWGVFQVLVHALGGLSTSPFLYGLPVVLGLSFVPIFALTLRAGLAACGVRGRGVALALWTSMLFSLHGVAYHLLYIHTNLASALYLFSFVVLFWLAEVEREAGWIPLAFLSLVAFALQRTETPLVGLVFLALVLARTELPRRWLSGPLTAFVAVIVVWYEVVAAHAPVDEGFSTPQRCHLVAGAALVALLWWWASAASVVRRLNRFVPAAIALAIGLALVMAFAFKTEHMLDSARSWLTNLTELEPWGQAFYGVIVLGVLGLLAASPPRRTVFVVGIFAYLALILLLSYLGQPYRLGVGDSANRMTMHLVPLIFFYLALELVPLAEPWRRDAS